MEHFGYVKFLRNNFPEFKTSITYLRGKFAEESIEFQCMRDFYKIWEIMLLYVNNFQKLRNFLWVYPIFHVLMAIVKNPSFSSKNVSRIIAKVYAKTVSHFIPVDQFWQNVVQKFVPVQKKNVSHFIAHCTTLFRTYFGLH